MSSNMKRIKIHPKKPNPLFEKWLQEWKDEAAAKGSDMQYCFGKALASLRKYPLPLNSGRDCGILQNFGNRLCVMLDRKLVEYRKQGGDLSTCDASEKLTDSSSSSVNGILIKENNNINSREQLKRKKKELSSRCSSSGKRAEYIPAYRSGAYAILLSLFTSAKMENYKGFLEKSELISVAQPLCDASFTKSDGPSHYTAWSSMSTLIKKGLVGNVGRGKYSLTVEGESLAQKIQNVTGESTLQDINMLEVQDKPLLENVSEISAARTHELSKKVSCTGGMEGSSVILAPGTFDVILLVDTQEASGISGRKGRSDSPFNNLDKHNVKYEFCHLKVGDFTWICRDRSTGHAVVLPYIVERKRIDDFSRSIMDGRFREQKFRLKQCGIPNLIYLVEKYAKESHTAIPLSTLNQAATSTEVTDGFIVKYTSNRRESASYLSVFTHILTNLFSVKTLVTCSKKDIPSFCINDDLIYLMSFQEFNSSSMKQKALTVREMFIKHLIQLSGISVEKALAIVEKYPTPHALYKAVQNGGNTNLLSEISYGSLSRRMGPVVSKSICELYSNSILL